MIIGTTIKNNKVVRNRKKTEANIKKGVTANHVFPEQTTFVSNRLYWLQWGIWGICNTGTPTEILQRATM